MAPRTTFIVGDRDGGKSTTLIRLLGLPPWKAMRACGILALANVDKTQYNLKDLASQEVRLGLCMEERPGWKQLGRFFYDEAAFRWANERVISSLATAELAVFDEIGRLELDGGGLAPSFGQALQADGPCVLAVVRTPFVEAVKTRFGIGTVGVVDVGGYGNE